MKIKRKQPESENRGTKLNKTLIFFVAGLVLCLITPTATCVIVNDEELRVEPDNWKFLVLSGRQGGILQIDVEVLTEYAQIDVLIMNEYNWYRYNTTDENKEFDLLESRLKITLTSFTFTAPEDDIYYIVLDNSWDPDNGAYVTFPVDVHITVSDVTLTPSIGVTGVITCIGLIFFVSTILRSKKRKEKEE